MTTLQDLKQQAGLTNAAIARSLGCSTSKAGMILQGRYLST
ncbi:MAG TPA: helix-turn-helix domain-containing protein [Ktedonobacteraceae bacterium]